MKAKAYGRGEDLGSAPTKNPPAYRTRNAETVEHGTGEALLGRARATQRESERGIVPFERTDNRTGREGRPRSRTRQGEEHRW
jgi:hypothetical protein